MKKIATVFLAIGSALVLACFAAAPRTLAAVKASDNSTTAPTSVPASSPTISGISQTPSAAKSPRRVVRKHQVRRRIRRPTRRMTRYRSSRHKVLRKRASARRSRVRRVYRRVSYTGTSRVTYRRALYHRRVWSPWSVSSFGDSSFGDSSEGENPIIRQAAIEALGRLNGAVVVVDPSSGRILSIVNQKLALTRGYIPCSTVKPMVALAGLSNGAVTLKTRLRGMSGAPIDMTEALAHSDNEYFARLGEMLGFSRVERVAEELGYGQRATTDIPGESPGVFPSEPPSAKEGGVGKLTSFGTGIDQTPLQMAAILSAIANGGTLYYLQYPRTPEEIGHFQPKVRRHLTDLAPYIPAVREGMAAAVLYGTARLAYNPEENIFGKTGTCSEDGGRMGWFVSYSDAEKPRYVVVVMLRGGQQMFGPHAAGIGGVLYRSLLPTGIQPGAAEPSSVNALPAAPQHSGG